jgi:hypothetical protein
MLMKRNPQKYLTLLFGNDEIDISGNDNVGLHQHQFYVTCSIVSIVVYVLDLLTLLYVYDL